MTILEKIKTLPKTSGVYIMKDNLNQIIYIGKAKNLKNRVSQYFLKNQSHSKVKAMVEKVVDFDYLLTPSEIDALALESNLIKNPKAKRTENITRLGEYCRYRLILNGTPITKTEADLYSQWYFLDWRVLGYKSFWSFAANHLEYDDAGRIIRSLNTDYLTKKMAPYSYQVKK